MSRLFIDSFRSSGLGKVSKSIARARKRHEAKQREIKQREHAVFMKHQRLEVINQRKDINRMLLREKTAAKKELMREANELKKDKMRERERLIKERATKKQIPEPRKNESLNDYLHRV